MTSRNRSRRSASARGCVCSSPASRLKSGSAGYAASRAAAPTWRAGTFPLRLRGLRSCLATGWRQGGSVLCVGVPRAADRGYLFSAPKFVVPEQRRRSGRSLAGFSALLVLLLTCPHAHGQISGVALPGADTTVAKGVSADGSTLAGNGTVTATGQSTAFLWQPSTGFTLLGTLPGFNSYVARAVNGDGSVVIHRHRNGPT
jgi:hypothetical protein